MVATKSKVEDKTETKLIENFMPKWAKEEKCFTEVQLRDARTKKIVEGGWPHPKSTDELVYENWLDSVLDKETGQYYPQRDKDGMPIKGTGARYVVTVLTRIRNGKNEHLYSKGRLEGFNAGGEPVTIPIYRPEVWIRTKFDYKRTYDEKRATFVTETLGPSGSEIVYDIPFTAENVQKLYDKTDKVNCQFVVKDMQTDDPRSVKWSSVKDTLDLFMHKPFEYLWKADYMPAPVKQELRQEAIAQGLIHGASSDYQMQSQSSVGVE
jgi:hypothetical protein